MSYALNLCAKLRIGKYMQTRNMSRRTASVSAPTSPANTSGQKTLQSMMQPQQEKSAQAAQAAISPQIEKELKLMQQMLTNMISNIKQELKEEMNEVANSMKDKMNNIKDDIKQTLQEKIEKMGEKMEGRMSKIEENTGRMEEKMDETMRKIEGKIAENQQKTEENKQRIQKVEQTVQAVGKKLETVDQYFQQIDPESERTSMRLEMDHAEYSLRLQNLEEDKGENLGELIPELLANYLGIEKSKMEDQMDEIYRVHTRYAMRNKLPREVHVRFTKKRIRNDILQKARDEPLKFKEKEIKILKQVPKRIRDRRRDYQFLTKQLVLLGINFRWLIPEGILVHWQQQKHRLDSLMKAREFYDTYILTTNTGRKEEMRAMPLLEGIQQERLEALEGATGGMEPIGPYQQLITLDVQIPGIENQAQRAIEGAIPKAQREPKSPRNGNPFYN